MGVPTAADEQELRRMIDDLYGALSGLDADRLGRNKLEDYTVFDLFTPDLLHEGEELQAFRRADIERTRNRGELSLDVSEPEVHQWADCAVACYTVGYRFGPPTHLTGRVRVTDVFVRQDGAWLFAHHNEGAVPSGQPHGADASSD